MQKNMRAGLLAATTTLCLAATACGNVSSGSDEEWPGRSVEMVIPTAAGGALDTVFRQIQPYIEEELGAPLAVEYREGGQFAIGTSYVQEQGADCEPLMFHAIPDIIFSYLTQEVPYTYDDFYPVAGLSVEPSTLFVQNDAPWETLEEFVEDAKSRPGEIRVSVANLTNADTLAVLNLEQAAGIDVEIISYDGGGPARNALVAGEVEAAMGGVFAGMTIAEDTRALGVFQQENEWPDLTDNAPSVNEALGTDIPDIGGSFGFFTTRECYQDNRDRFDSLAKAVESATKNEEYLAGLAEIGEESKLVFRTPTEYDEFIKGEIEYISGQLEEQPEVFGVEPRS